MRRKVLLGVLGAVVLAVSSGCIGYDECLCEGESDEGYLGDSDDDPFESHDVDDENGPQECSTWAGLIVTPTEPLVAHATLCERESTGGVHGYVSWQGKRTGSGRHEVEGSWSDDGMRLSMRDVRIAAEMLRPGASFGSIDAYDLGLSGATLQGPLSSENGEVKGTLALQFIEATRVGEGT